MNEPRFAPVAPADLTAAQRVVYDAVAGGRRAQGSQAIPLTDSDGRLRGPFNAMLISPVLGNALQAVGAAVRYDGSLTDRERELAILVVANHWRSRFEWESHAAVARRAGVTEAEINAVAAGSVAPAEPREAAAVTWVRTLVQT